MPDAYEAFLKLDARACWETEQTEQPQLYRLSHVILTQGQHNPMWPAMP